MASNIVSIQHLRREQEEEDTLMLVHALVATQSGATSIYSFRVKIQMYSF